MRIHLLLPVLFYTYNSFASERQIEIRNLVYNGNSFWTPSDFVVLEGDQVNLKLINDVNTPEGMEKIDSQFEIVGLVQPVKVSNGEIKDVSFSAKEPGVYRIRNQNSETEGRVIIIRK